MPIYQYCKSIVVFYTLKTRFENSAFNSNGTLCTSDATNALIDAENMYLFVNNNIQFINRMKTGCKMGGSGTKCKIKNSGVDDILAEFNNSYHNYIEYPKMLCSPFSEFTNNLESLFITGGCYLDNTSIEICKYGFKC